MEKIKIGIIGTGVGIRTHLPGFRLCENAEVIAISGSSQNRSKEFAEKNCIPFACKDYKELCDLEELDLVCVTSPNKYHFEMVKYAMSKGKNIICEKPVSDNINEVESLLELTKNYDKIIIIDHQLRFNPYIKKIKELIENDILGKVFLVRLNQQGTGFSNLNAAWNWSFDGKEGGGVRLAMASHFNDLMQFWFNDIRVDRVSGTINPVFKNRINSNGIKTNITASTICTAKIDFQDELCALYTINAGAYSTSRFDIDIYGDKGELSFDLQNKLCIYTIDKKGEKQIVNVDNVFEDELENKVSIFSGSFRYCAPIIVNAIQKKDISMLNEAAKIQDAVYNVKLLDAIRSSSNNGDSILYFSEVNVYV